MEDINQKVKFKDKRSNSKIKNEKDVLIGRCYKVSLQLINYYDKQQYNNVSDILQKQLLRSTTSIGANLVEAKAASSRRDYKKFFEIALKSSNESKYWLKLLIDSDITNKKMKELLKLILSEVIELSNMIGKSVLTLKGK